ELLYNSISPQLQALPAWAATTKRDSARLSLYKPSKTRLLPSFSAAKAASSTRKQSKSIRLAKANFEEEPAVVLDYVIIVGGGYYNGDVTLQADTTYYVTGSLYVGGTLTIEGGAVIKYDENGSFN